MAGLASILVLALCFLDQKYLSFSLLGRTLGVQEVLLRIKGIGLIRSCFGFRVSADACVRGVKDDVGQCRGSGCRDPAQLFVCLVEAFWVHLDSHANPKTCKPPNKLDS